jgi:hypothetical protein
VRETRARVRRDGLPITDERGERRSQSQLTGVVAVAEVVVEELCCEGSSRSVSPAPSQCESHQRDPVSQSDQEMMTPFEFLRRLFNGGT